jgi:polyhydroxybutyrate depolymerase
VRAKALLAALLAGCARAPEAVVVSDASTPRDAGDSAAVAADVPPPPPDVPAEDVSASGPCAPRAVPAGDVLRTVRVGGVERVFRVHVPRGYDPTRPATVVLNFHGNLSDDAQQDDWSNLSAAADARGILAVHPRGRDQSWNAGVCCGLAQARGDDDVGFVRALLDDLAGAYCVDPRRVFAAGFSNGAFFAQRLGCELSDRVAAVASVAGLMTLSTCAPTRAMSVLQFHGDADLVVPYLGNPLLQFPPARSSAQGWATRGRCGAAAETLRRGAARCESFVGCADGAEVVLCTLGGAGHTWPGGDVPITGGVTNRDLDATAMMLDFFARHPRP